MSVPLATGSIAAANPPVLYRQPLHESPVRGAPDDLLLIAGYGFKENDTVVYEALTDTTQVPAHPAALPASATARQGVAEVVSRSDIPYSLTIKLPQALLAGQSYALWVYNPRGGWSKPVKINDARPSWISPAFVYASGRVAALPREIKVVGRNLQPAPGRTTQVRLTGPATFTARALPGEKDAATLDEYVARIGLPKSLVPGSYRVQVSRDAVSWVEVPDQLLEVRADPPPSPTFSVAEERFGGCRPDDGRDDTSCVAQAIAAAAEAGRGIVLFGPGTWDLVKPPAPGQGLKVPPGVDLLGSGAGTTTIDRHAGWSARSPAAAFVLVGHNSVQGFTFHDRQVYQPEDTGTPFLEVGRNYLQAASDAQAAAIAEDIVIAKNVFDKTFVAIQDNGLPLRRVFITYNTFGAYLSALELGGNRFNMLQKFRIDDAVIDFNRFKPSSRLSEPRKSGPIASELGAGYRVDFSANDADGSATDYLYDPADARGWASTFFWNMSGSVEETLVAQNSASCSGDKVGDGAGVAFDNNANTFAFATLAQVLAASATRVAASEILSDRQNSRDVPVASYYVGHWLQVVDGPGIGEARRIESYSIDSLTHRPTFTVAPAWDVIPVPGRSRVAIGREFWQLLVVDNRIDHRTPLCQKSNRSRHAGGGIVLWAQSADSVIAGNRQFDTDGILFQQAYIPPEHPCADCVMQSFFNSFLDIRDNLVDGEYDWGKDCSSSGIQAGLAAAPWNDPLPPTVGYGNSVSHNHIRHADSEHGGALALVASWHAGPEPHRWPLSDNMLIHHNVIEDIAGEAALALCSHGQPRVGIGFPSDDIAWRTVLYANRCKNVSLPLRLSPAEPAATGTVRLCAARTADSCECP